MHKSNRVVLFAFTILLCSLLACQQFPIAATPASSLHLEQGRQALTDERYDEAISKLTTAIADDANNAEAYYLRGSAYYGRYETAYSNNDPNADGPAKIAPAYAIDKRWNGIDLCAPDSDVFIEKADAAPDSAGRAAP